MTCHHYVQVCIEGGTAASEINAYMANSAKPFSPVVSRQDLKDVIELKSDTLNILWQKDVIVIVISRLHKKLLLNTWISKEE